METPFIDCTGDVVVGDTIRWTEAVFHTAYRRGERPRPAGARTILAKVVRDSYGAAKQQHTFTLEVISCSGIDQVAPGAQILRKGRNIYRHKTERLPWPDETARRRALDEKHDRGGAARRAREKRIADQIDGYDRDDLGESPDF